MVHRLDTGRIQLSVLNFSDRLITGRVESEHVPPAGEAIDMFTDQVIAEVDHEHGFTVSLEPHQGMSLLIVPRPAGHEHGR
jgi:maltose alpha-D-glucosyltransferase/alpha-amylase